MAKKDTILTTSATIVRRDGLQEIEAEDTAGELTAADIVIAMKPGLSLLAAPAGRFLE